jgi:hypothetical protein
MFRFKRDSAAKSEDISADESLGEFVNLEEKEFKVQTLLDLLKDCNEKLSSSGDVYLSDYIKMANEVKKMLFHLHGFGFFINRFNSKLLILAQHLKKDPDNYETVDKMIKHEKESNLLHPSELYDSKLNATKNLIELYRPMAFINVMLEKLHENEDVSTSKLAIETYDYTLAPYHSRFVAMAVRSAMFFWPGRDTILSYVFSTPQELELYSEFVDSNAKFMKTMNAILEKYDALNLP